MLLFKDTFQGVDGTALAAHSPLVGGPWTDPVPGLQLQSNHLEATGDSASEAPLGKRTATVVMDVDYNGMDNSTLLQVGPQTGDLLNKITVQIYGNGDITLETWAVNGLPKFNGPLTTGPRNGAHTVVLVVSALWAKVLLDGALLIQVPRIVLPAVIFDSLSLSVASLLGASPKVSRLLVSP